MAFTDRIIVFVGKAVSWAIRALGVGVGSTWPGEIVLRLRPRIISSFARQNIHVILVAGTNGKTTTAKMITTILRSSGKRVFHNESGANLDNGIVSAFIGDSLLWGQLRSGYFVFETDEATLPVVLSQCHPDVVVLLNLFRDQLDRYGEVDTIAEKWSKALSMLTPAAGVLINGDDPHLAYIGTKLRATVKYFGLDDPSLYRSKMEHASDTIFCPSCGHRLTFGGIFFSHLGKWACGRCRFIHPPNDVSSKDFRSPVEGVYNKYNTIAAAFTARMLGVSSEDITRGLSAFTPAFGRSESLFIDGKLVKILLSKNPTGLNESLRTVLASREAGPLLLALNDRIPDGTDVSWIWDVDFEMIPKEKVIIVSGDRACDLGVRIKYADIPEETCMIVEGLVDAVHKALETTETGQTLWILPTYSAMLEVREVLLGKKIL